MLRVFNIQTNCVDVDADADADVAIILAPLNPVPRAVALHRLNNLPCYITHDSSVLPSSSFNPNLIKLLSTHEPFTISIIAQVYTQCKKS